MAWGSRGCYYRALQLYLVIWGGGGEVCVCPPRIKGDLCCIYEHPLAILGSCLVPGIGQAHIGPHTLRCLGITVVPPHPVDPHAVTVVTPLCRAGIWGRVSPSGKCDRAMPCA